MAPIRPMVAIETSWGVNAMDRESMKLLIAALRQGEIGLNDRRQSILKRVPEPGDWGMFRKQVEAMDLVWLAAATGDCFELYQCSALIYRGHDGKLYNFETDEPVEA